MEYYNKIICVTFEDLTSGKGAIMTKGALDKILYRNPSLRLRRPARDLPTLIDYYSLPLRYRRVFEEKNGDPKTLLEKEAVKATLILDTKAREYFTGYRYDKGTEKDTSLPEELIEEYTINASVLNILIDRYYDCKAYRKALGGSVKGIWDIVAGTSEELRKTYGHTLPNNTARLREKMNRYKKEGYPSLVSGKVGNSSATVITEEAGRFIIALKRSPVPVYTDRQIFDEFNRKAPEMGWRRLKSVKALSLYLNRPEITPLWWSAVHGELSAHQRYSRKNLTELPSMRDALWYGDGTKLNLFYKAQEGGRMVVRTMQVYEVMDAYSEVFLGYHISETEDYEAQYNAYRMAVWTAGHKPYELVCDNQGGHKKLKAQDFFQKICHVYRPTAPHSGQSKTIESAFGRFQSQILHKDWRFTGQNVTAKKKSSKPNMEMIAANVDKLYTLEELKEAYAGYRREWNESKHPATGVSRMEMYRNSVNPMTQPLTVRDMVDLFWIYTDKPSTYTDYGLKVTIKGKSYRYEVYGEDGMPDHEFLRNNYGRKFLVQYDPCDMASVNLYTIDANGAKRFSRVAKPYFKIHRALQEQEEGEQVFIRAQIEANRQDRLERQAAARAIELEHGVTPEQNGLRRPKLAGINMGDNEVKREIDRRVEKYTRSSVPLTPGKIGKMISEAVYNPQTGGIEFDERRVAGKL